MYKEKAKFKFSAVFFGELEHKATITYDNTPEEQKLLDAILEKVLQIMPRTKALKTYNKICENNPLFSKRLIVRPGLTGLAQIHNPIATPNDSFEKLQFDVYYIKNSSIKMFFIIFINTIKIILQKKSL